MIRPPKPHPYPRPKSERLPREKSMTIAAAIFGQNGTVLAADSEEVIPDAFRGRGEKIHIISPHDSPWKAAMAGAGDLDFILMTRDFIREKIEASINATDMSWRGRRDSFRFKWSS